MNMPAEEPTEEASLELPPVLRAILDDMFVGPIVHTGDHEGELRQNHPPMSA